MLLTASRCGVEGGSHGRLDRFSSRSACARHEDGPATTEGDDMSGVTGWVDFTRDLTREHATVLAMTATLAHRGPSGEGVWVGGHAALGHRRDRKSTRLNSSH